MLKVMSLRPEVTCPAAVGSWAVAEKVKVPLTVPAVGEVRETVGEVVSGLEEVVAEADEDWDEVFPAAS